jgi:hypothetical protein
MAGSKKREKEHCSRVGGMFFQKAWVEVQYAFVVYIFSGVFDPLFVLYMGILSVNFF